MKPVWFFLKRNNNHIILSSIFFLSIITALSGFALSRGQFIFHPLKYTFSLPIYKHSLTEWNLDTTVGNVDLYYKIAVCNGANTVFLKFNNRNNHTVNISWKELFSTQQVAAKSENMEGEKKLLLLPGETAASNCEDTKNKACIILAEKAIPTYKATIIDFKFKDITVF